MSLITIPNTFSAGAVIVASQHNSNFSTIASDYNGNIDNTNIAPGASIAYSKLNLATSIVNADVSASAAIAYSKLNLATSIVNADVGAAAAIVDTKLAQITTASKVSGTAITGLASLPAGAGVIPAANLPSPGSMTLITATALSGVTTSGNISITSGQTYFVTYNLTFDSTADTPSLRFNADSGAGHYKYAIVGSTTTGAFTSLSASATQINLSRTVLPISTGGINGHFYIQQVGASSQIYRIWGQSAYDDQVASLFSCANNSGSWFNTANATSFVINSTGQTMTGTIYLYKISLV